ncbi:Ldh family oxidoreductase [Ancylobacter mangrovi]|uniref:Ldh family oxidoreductase n=1 Tax=Ancylobacter mangrovi TaxID=2972472 RepID=A0A9X2PIW3_9HYPH|nr:Ldh family oxidoreductase [Ancylobacter mangrovi]MCS0496052.1 Ldh family oxidoreductase [Ancylobacter mangrovi]MCS0504529.1 Ldh family oxidoreductase [Ancylobacter mangrovi]
MSETALKTQPARQAWPAAILIDFIARALETTGMRPADAAIVGELMIEADLNGADAHGIFRLPQYVQLIRDGAINPTAEISVKKTAAATALVDGGNGMGHLVVKRVADTAIELARESGIGWVGCHRSNHAGSGSVYAAMPVQAGMIGIYAAVANANHMAVWGGMEAALGTNPLAIGMPMGEDRQLMLDMATSMVSYGTVKKHAMQGQPLQEGWMVDLRTGGPLIDAAQSSHGLLLPIGGYKGSGLALMLGFLAGTLNGAAMGLDIVDFNAVTDTPTDTGQFVIAIDIERFVPRAQFESELRRHSKALKGTARMPGVDEIRLPGEQRNERRARRMKDGLQLAAPLVAKLNALADKLGIAPL